MKNTYLRVLPRDLFNESKLLKNMGQLCLAIHDGITPVPMNFHHDGEPFNICQNPNDGALYVANLTIWVNRVLVEFTATYNSKKPFTLWARTRNDDYEVFTNEGDFHPDFINFCIKLAAHEDEN